MSCVLTSPTTKSPLLTSRTNGEVQDIVPGALVPAPCLPILPCSGNTAGASAIDPDLDNTRQIATLDTVQVPAPIVESGLRSDLNFQLLDDVFFRYPLDEQFSLPWFDFTNNQVSEQYPDPMAAPSLGENQPSDQFLEWAPAEVEQAKLNLTLFDVENRLREFKFPSIYKTARFVRGFWKYFSAHTPLVHAASFSIGTCPGKIPHLFLLCIVGANKTLAPLLLAVMACGAVYVNEHQAAVRLNHAVLKLLSEVRKHSSPLSSPSRWTLICPSQNEELVVTGQRDAGFYLWEFQTRILACQFGLFSGDSRLQQQARMSFPRLEIVFSESSIYI